MGQIDRMFDREPPVSANAERSLLGSMLLDPQVIDEVVQVVPDGAMLYIEGHSAIFRELVSIYTDRQSCDIVQIAERLKASGTLGAVGGSKYLVQLAESVPSAANARHYAQIVADRYRLRRLVDAAGEILYDVYHHDDGSMASASGILEQAEQRIYELADVSSVNEPQDIGSLVAGVLESIRSGAGADAIPTGFADLDRMLGGGLRKSEFLIVAGRPSMGKTALAMSIASEIAKAGRTVALYSLEMDQGSVATRTLSAVSGVDAADLRTGSLTPDQARSLEEAADLLKAQKLIVDDTASLTIAGLRSRARRLRRRRQVEVVVVDYLQLMSAGGRQESRQVEVSAISRGVKAMARELGVPVLCLAQLNRSAESRADNRPKMADLRESGSIEQDADVVMLLHREEYYHRDDPHWALDPDNEDKLGLAEVIIAKQRNGPTGVVELHWDANTTRFHNRARKPSAGWAQYAGGAA